MNSVGTYNKCYLQCFLSNVTVQIVINIIHYYNKINIKELCYMVSDSRHEKFKNKDFLK